MSSNQMVLLFLIFMFYFLWLTKSCLNIESVLLLFNIELELQKYPFMSCYRALLIAYILLISVDLFFLH